MTLSRSDSLTPSLHVLARRGDLCAIEQAVALGAPIDQEDLFGSTPLHLATLYEHRPVVEYLLAQGAQVNSEAYFTFTESNMLTYTPLDLAIKYNSSPEVLSMLLSHGAESADWENTFYSLFETLCLEMMTRSEPTALFDLTLAKMTTLGTERGDFIAYDPISTCFAEILGMLEQGSYTDRLQAAQALILTANEPYQEAEKFELAKNLLHTFPSDKTYALSIRDRIVEVDAQGYMSIPATLLAAKSVTAYTDSLIANADTTAFQRENPDPLAGYKIPIFEAITDCFQQSAQTVIHHGWQEVSQNLYQEYQAGQTLLLPSGWEGHFINIILDPDLNLLLVANAGQQYPELTPGLNAYDLHAPIEMHHIYQILNTENQIDLEYKLHYDLGLSPNLQYSFETNPQVFGNCGWNSQRVAEQGLLMLELYKLTNDSELSLSTAQIWFEELDSFHQTMVLADYLKQPYLEVAALTDILFDYHSVLDSPAKIERATMILEPLSAIDSPIDLQAYYAEHSEAFSHDLVNLMHERGYLPVPPAESVLLLEDLFVTEDSLSEGLEDYLGAPASMLVSDLPCPDFQTMAFDTLPLLSALPIVTIGTMEVLGA